MEGNRREQKGTEGNGREQALCEKGREGKRREEKGREGNRRFARREQALVGMRMPHAYVHTGARACTVPWTPEGVPYLEGELDGADYVRTKQGKLKIRCLDPEVI